MMAWRAFFTWRRQISNFFSVLCYWKNLNITWLCCLAQVWNIQTCESELKTPAKYSFFSQLKYSKAIFLLAHSRLKNGWNWYKSIPMILCNLNRRKRKKKLPLPSKPAKRLYRNSYTRISGWHFYWNPSSP